MDAMKKMLRKIKKTKKHEFNNVAVTSDEMCKDAVPDAPRNLKIKIPERSELYRNFRINNGKEFSNEQDVNQHHNYNSILSEQEESLKYSCSESPNSEAIPVANINCRQRSVSSPETGLQSSTVESHFIQPRGFNSEELRATNEDLPNFGSESSSESGSDLREINEIESLENLTNSNSVIDNDTTLNSKTDEISDHKKILKKPKNNTYVINISNSQHFQIGSQKNVFVNGAQNNSLPIPGLKNYIKNLPVERNKKQEMLDLSNELSKVTRTITDQEITKIASHVDDDWIMENWREFGKNLGLEQPDIDSIEIVGGENPKLIVFDMLKTLKEKNPDPSIGFIVKVLTKSNQFRAIQQLVS